MRDRGLNGATDAAVLAKAFAEDRILVTGKVADFRKLAGAVELHAGIVVIDAAGLLRDDQERVVRAALKAIETEHAAGRSMVNRVLTSMRPARRSSRRCPGTTESSFSESLW